MNRTPQASERTDFTQAVEEMGSWREHLSKILARLARIAEIPPRARLLDIGAAQGQVLIAAGRLGYQAVGIEPWAPARQVAEQLAAHAGETIDIRAGTAETFDAEPDSFDIVHVCSVMEHVRDPQLVFENIYRVLRPGGVLWFCTTNSLCPCQVEIRGFPAFSWYPLRLKRSIMRWAQEHRPELIGHTATPAMHWFTPGKVKRMLRRAGFERIYDRWDLRRPEEGGRLHAAMLRVIQHVGPARLLADVCLPHGSYAAVK
jgi:SAM-dependent methyltransferase